jgi:hypothetical protein
MRPLPHGTQERRWILVVDSSEFIGNEFQRSIKEECNIEAEPSSKRNRQSDAILERIHQTIGNVLCTFEVENQPNDGSDPWSGILSAAGWVHYASCRTLEQQGREDDEGKG